MVAREERLACVAECAEGREIELREAVGVVGRSSIGCVGLLVEELGRAAVDWGSAHAHLGAGVDVAAGRGAPGVVGRDGEGLVLRVVLGFGVDFGEGHGAAGTDAAGGDVAGAVAEDEAGNDVEETNDNAQDTRSDEQAPEWHAQGLLACGFLVHVSEHVESDGHHGAAQRDETMRRTQQRPVAGKEVAEKRAFRDDEEEASDCCDDVTASIEEEELGDNEGFDKHDNTGGDDRSQGDNVQAAHDVKNNVARSSQVFS